MDDRHFGSNILKVFLGKVESKDFSLSHFKKNVWDFIHKNETVIDDAIVCGNFTKFSPMVYTGVSGVCYMYLWMHLNKAILQLSSIQNTSLKSIMKDDFIYLKKALKLIHPIADIQCNKLKTRAYRERDITFLEGAAGPLAMAVVILDMCAKKELVNQNDATITINQCLYHLHELHHIVKDQSVCISNELLYGRVGYLYACMFVNRYFKEHKISVSTILDPIAKIILKEGIEYAQKFKGESKPPLMWFWHNSDYLGAAHGVTGILYILLQLKVITSDEKTMQLIEDTADWLCKNTWLKSGNFKSSLESRSDRLVQWCHGSPGVILFFLKLYEITGKEKYLEVGEKSSECIWERGLLKKGFGICHGTGSCLHALMKLYLLTKNPMYLKRSITFASFIMDDNNSKLIYVPDSPLSLFEGMAGTICILMNLLRILETSEKEQDATFAHFPAFDLPF